MNDRVLYDMNNQNINIFDDVDRDLIWKTLGGPKLIEFIGACLIFIIILILNFESKTLLKT